MTTHAKPREHLHDLARLDADRTAKPKTRLLGHLAIEDGQRAHCVAKPPADTIEDVATGERVMLRPAFPRDLLEAALRAKADRAPETGSSSLAVTALRKRIRGETLNGEEMQALSERSVPVPADAVPHDTAMLLRKLDTLGVENINLKAALRGAVKWLRGFRDVCGVPLAELGEWERVLNTNGGE